MKHDIDVPEELLYRVPVADVTHVQPDSITKNLHHILSPAVSQIIHDDQMTVSIRQLTDQLRTNESGTSGHENTRALNIHILPSSTLPVGYVLAAKNHLGPAAIAVHAESAIERGCEIDAASSLTSQHKTSSNQNALIPQ